MMAKQPEKFPLPMVDTSDLTDADRAEISKLRNGWVAGGHKGLQRAISELFKTPIIGTRIMAAFYPEMVKEVIEDEVAKGMTKEDLEELIRKLESSKRKQ